MSDKLVLWMSKSVLKTCLDEADREYPMESGGTFMGWWADEETVVISTVIGPGPKAVRGPFSFQPDQNWQLEKIAEHYAASGRKETYLGDWHSHPNAVDGQLSWRDRTVLRRIIQSASARCPAPIMLIVWGNPERHNISAWAARFEARRLLWDQLVVTGVPEIEVF